MNPSILILEDVEKINSELAMFAEEIGFRTICSAFDLPQALRAFGENGRFDFQINKVLIGYSRMTESNSRQICSSFQTNGR